MLHRSRSCSPAGTDAYAELTPVAVMSKGISPTRPRERPTQPACSPSPPRTAAPEDWGVWERRLTALERLVSTLGVTPRRPLLRPSQADAALDSHSETVDETGTQRGLSGGGGVSAQLANLTGEVERVAERVGALEASPQGGSVGSGGGSPRRRIRRQVGAALSMVQTPVTPRRAVFNHLRSRAETRLLIGRCLGSSGDLESIAKRVDVGDTARAALSARIGRVASSVEQRLTAVEETAAAGRGAAEAALRAAEENEAREAERHLQEAAVVERLAEFESRLSGGLQEVRGCVADMVTGLGASLSGGAGLPSSGPGGVLAWVMRQASETARIAAQVDDLKAEGEAARKAATDATARVAELEGVLSELRQTQLPKVTATAESARTAADQAGEELRDLRKIVGDVDDSGSVVSLGIESEPSASISAQLNVLNTSVSDARHGVENLRRVLGDVSPAVPIEVQLGVLGEAIAAARNAAEQSTVDALDARRVVNDVVTGRQVIQQPHVEAALRADITAARKESDQLRKQLAELCDTTVAVRDVAEQAREEAREVRRTVGDVDDASVSMRP
eukprot:Hpha_TRINITY_DN15141_c1_g2::TRINITY_DN15141_c1_g2_i1::g.128889::m.128889